MSVITIKISKSKPDSIFNFGYYRSEVLGTLASVMFIWIVTINLTLESIIRLYAFHHEINEKIMLLVAFICLLFNICISYAIHINVKY